MKDGDDLLSVLVRQFYPSLETVKGLIDRCPDELWLKNVGRPYWQHIYHALVGPDFWFRMEEFRLYSFKKDVTPDLTVKSKDSLTREEMGQYYRIVKEKCDRFFNSMNTQKLFLESYISKEHTNTDLVLSQIRHIQHHVGFCNCLLRQHDFEAVEWRGYGE